MIICRAPLSSLAVGIHIDPSADYSAAQLSAHIHYTKGLATVVAVLYYRLHSVDSCLVLLLILQRMVITRVDGRRVTYYQQQVYRMYLCYNAAQ
jgi:hypothetical protein